MSATAFLHYIKQVHEDPAIPTFTSTLPSLDKLHDSTRQSPFVLKYTPETASRHTTQALGSGAEARASAVPTLVGSTTEAFVTSLLSAGWPFREPTHGLPLLEVGTSVLAASTAPGAGTEFLLTTRYEIPSTVFAVERYTVVAVPSDPRNASDMGRYGSEGAGGATAVGSQERAQAQEEEQSLRAQRAAAAADSARGVALPTPGFRKPSDPTTALAGLSFLQKQSTRVLLTVCRVVSSAGGAVPEREAAAKHLVSLSAASTNGFAVSSAPSASLSSRTLATRFHVFLNAPVPLLGADAERRQQAWQRVQVAGDLPLVVDMMDHTSAATVYSQNHSREEEADDGAGKGSNANTTLLSNVSAMSEQGQTPAEGSRQPSHPQSHSATHQATGSHPQQRGAAASTNTSMTSVEGTASRLGNSGSSVQVRWGSVPAAHAPPSSKGGDGMEPDSVGGPVGVTPLPSMPRGRLSGAAQEEEAAALSATVAGDAHGAAHDVFAEIYAECGAYFTPAAMSQRAAHLHWQLDAVESLFLACPPYNSHTLPRLGGSGNGAMPQQPAELTVTEGWQRWVAVCSSGLSRPLIVNSMDEIIGYCGCSRGAFFCAVGMLDYFVIRTASDPAASCLAYANFVRAGRHRQHQQQRYAYGGGSAGSGEQTAFGPGSPGHLTEVSDKEISDFFTQVIGVCCMLGSKMKDTFPPELTRLLACLNSNKDEANAFTPVEFTLMEFFLLQRVFHFSHLSEMTTVNEVVDLLLFLVGGDAVRDLAELSRHSRTLKRRGAENQALAPQVQPRIDHAEISLLHSRQDYLDRIAFAMATEAAHPESKSREWAGFQGNEEASQGMSGVRHAASASTAVAPSWMTTTTTSTTSTSTMPLLCSQGVRIPELNKDQVREWRRLSLLSSFLSDVAVRGPKVSSSSESIANEVDAALDEVRRQRGSAAHLAEKERVLRVELEQQVAIRLQCSALESSPCALGVAIVAVIAEALRAPLPLPLFAILPDEEQSRLREKGLAPRRATTTTTATPRDMAGEGNEESFLTRPTSSTEAASFSSLDKVEGFPVQPHDDLYLVLAHFCALFARNELAQQQQARALGMAAGHGLSLPRALEEVRIMYREGRDGNSWDPILRRRYKEMPSM